MTDTSILPGAELPAPATAPPAPDFEDDGPTTDRRRLLIIGAAVALLVLVGAFLLLRGGPSSSSSPSGAVPRGTPAAAAPASGGNARSSGNQTGPSKSGHGGAGTVLPPKSHTALARDPFKPLISAPVAGSTGSVTGSTTVAPARGSAPGTVPTSPSQGGAPSASYGAAQAIRLVSVHGTKDAVFDVTYSHHKVFRYDVIAPSASSAGGTVFGKEFSLLGIQGNDATVQVGDATPFDLVVGASHSV